MYLTFKMLKKILTLKKKTEKNQEVPPALSDPEQQWSVLAEIMPWAWEGTAIW